MLLVITDSLKIPIEIKHLRQICEKTAQIWDSEHTPLDKVCLIIKPAQSIASEFAVISRAVLTHLILISKHR